MPDARYRYNTLGIAAGYAGAAILAGVFGVSAWVGVTNLRGAGAFAPAVLVLIGGSALLVGYWAATLGIGIEVTDEGVRLRRLLALGWKFVPFERIIVAREHAPALARFDRTLVVIRLRGALAFWLCSDLPPGWTRWLPGLWPIFPDYPAAAAALRERLAPLGKFEPASPARRS